jgi:hypothetical protein
MMSVLRPETKARVLKAAKELESAAEAFGRAVSAFREAIQTGNKQAASSCGLGRQFIGAFGWHTPTGT